MESSIRRVGMLFAGGPAPAANAVISTAAVSFLRNNIEVYGLLHGYSHLVEYGPDHPMIEDRDYIQIDHRVLRRTRNSQGVLLGTARTNPGRDIPMPAHLKDPQRTAPLRAVYEALRSLEVDALISIGGDDTLKTANRLKLFQEQLPPGSKRMPDRPPAEDDRQRLFGHRFHVRLFHGRRGARRRGPQPAGRRRGEPQLLHGRDAWAAAPAGWPTARPSPARPAW